MIFGDQQNVKACTLMPNEGPDDVRAKMQAAINSFDDPDHVLFLIDLWSGTPFNQANILLGENEDKDWGNRYWYEPADGDRGLHRPDDHAGCVRQGNRHAHRGGC